MRAVITIGLVMLMALMLVGTASAASLQVSTADAAGTKGSTISIPITVSDASNLGSMDVVLVYDQNVLVASGVEKGGLNKGMITANTSLPGVVSIALADPSGIKGDGAVAIVTFSVTGNASQTSAITLQNVNAYDATTLLDIPVTVSSGTFTVTNSAVATAPAQTSSPAGSESLILFSLAGVAMAYLALRNRK